MSAHNVPNPTFWATAGLADLDRCSADRLDRQEHSPGARGKDLEAVFSVEADCRVVDGMDNQRERAGLALDQQGSLDRYRPNVRP